MTLLSALLGFLLLAGRGGAPQAIDLSTYRMVDLTHAYGSRTVYWRTPEHGGTHLDAPLHFAEGNRSADQVPLEQLIAKAVVIDARPQAEKERDYRLTREDVLAFEKAHGRIAAGTIVLLRTGWSRHWPDAKAYLGDDTPGDASKLSFPSYGVDAARLLVEERRVAALGVDTASIDYGRSTDFQVHRVAAAQNVPGLENLTNLDQLPATGALVIALPMKIEGGSGGPLRAVALVAR